MSAPRAICGRLLAAVLACVVSGGFFAGCSSDDNRQTIALHTDAAPSPHSTADLAPKYRSALQTLHRTDTAEEAKLALVQELAVDETEAAVRVLVAGASNSSIIVSMASIKGLGGRPCDKILAPLVTLLDDGEWQRRAWAAKVIGDTHCRDGLHRLTGRLQHERDPRVQQRIEAAIKALNEEVKG